MLLVRLVYLLIQSRDFESFWYDLERFGIQFQIARAISVVTFVVFTGCAAFALWTQDNGPTSRLEFYATLFVAWFGMALLPRFGLHRFPRTNSPRLYSEAQLTLILNFVLAVLSATCMTGLSAVYFWWRG
jgi:hypothetical protein